MSSVKKKRIEEDISALPDSALVERLLSGDKVLLGRYLTQDRCSRQFIFYANKFKSLSLHADEVRSIAAMLILRKDMHLVRTFKKNRLEAKDTEPCNDGLSLKEPSQDVSFAGYVFKALSHCLSDMLEKDSRNLGSRSKLQKTQEEQEEEQEKVLFDEREANIYLDRMTNPGVGIDEEAVTSRFSYLALDLNSCIARLSLKHQKMFYLLKVQRYKAEEVSEILNITVKDVYAETERIRKNLKEMLMK